VKVAAGDAKVRESVPTATALEVVTPADKRDYTRVWGGVIFVVIQEANEHVVDVLTSVHPTGHGRKPTAVRVIVAICERVDTCLHHIGPVLERVVNVDLIRLVVLVVVTVILVSELVDSRSWIM